MYICRTPCASWRTSTRGSSRWHRSGDPHRGLATSRVLALALCLSPLSLSRSLSLSSLSLSSLSL